MSRNNVNQPVFLGALLNWNSGIEISECGSPKWLNLVRNGPKWWCELGTNQNNTYGCERGNGERLVSQELSGLMWSLQYFTSRGELLEVVFQVEEWKDNQIKYTQELGWLDSFDFISLEWSYQFGGWSQKEAEVLRLRAEVIILTWLMLRRNGIVKLWHNLTKWLISFLSNWGFLIFSIGVQLSGQIVGFLKHFAWTASKFVFLSNLDNEFGIT